MRAIKSPTGSMHVAFRGAPLALIVIASLTGCVSAQPMLMLDTEGGDAWTFEKHIGGRIAAGECDSIYLHNGEARVEAVVHGERFKAAAPLRHGLNEIHAACHRHGRLVARSTTQQWRVPLPDVPKAWIRLRANATAVWLDAGRTQRAPGSPAPLVRFEWFARADNPAPLVEASTGDSLPDLQSAVGVVGEQIELAPPNVNGEYHVGLRATDAQGRFDESITMFRVTEGRATEIDLARDHPEWVDTAVVYGVAPFFFDPAGFDGVRERLDEIAALGVTVLWISPIAQSAPGDFGYAVTDHFQLRPTFGGETQFRQLVDAAHALGLKVMIDFVPNHVSHQHPWYVDVEQKQTRSAWRSWFERDEEGEVTHYFDWENLKNLNFDHPEVQTYVIAAFAHWLTAFDVDGFRVDASWAVRERAPEFWPRWRAELQRIDPDLFLLAEASVRDPYYVANGFDAAYDWTARLGEWAWADAFRAHGSKVGVGSLRDALTAGGEGLPPGSLTFRFMNNNDTGARFITRHGVGRTRLAAVMLFTLPGAPLIYNGQEVGAAFEPYDEGPPIDWRDPHNLTAHYTHLARLRRDTPALHGPDIELLATTHSEAVLAYRRPGVAPDPGLLVLLNFSTRELKVETPDARAFFASGSVKDLMTTQVIEVDPRRPEVTLQANQAVILQQR